MAARLSTVLLAVVLWLANACAGARPSLPSSALDALNKQQGIALGVAGVDALAASDAGAASNKHHKKKKKQKPYTSPQGLFIQVGRCHRLRMLCFDSQHLQLQGWHWQCLPP